MKNFFLFVLFAFTISTARAQLVADFTWCPVFDTTTQLCCIQFECLSTDSPGTITAYLYEFGDGNTGTTMDPLHCYFFVGTYIVTHLVSDNLGNTDTVSHSITITHLDSTGCNCDSLIGIPEQENASFILVFPNPSDENITFRWKTLMQSMQLTVYNNMGEQVSSQKIPSGMEFVLKRGALASGIYYYRFSTEGNSKLPAGKFILK